MHPVYRGLPRQYGGGLGSMFRSLFRTIMPLVTPVIGRAINTLKKEGPKHVFGAVGRVLAREKPKQVLKTEGLDFGKKLLNSIKEGFSTTLSHSSSGAHTHQPKQTGSGLHRLRKLKNQRKHKHQRKHKLHHSHKTRALDIFD